MHVDLGGYHVRDVEFTAAFDVTTDKVGKDLADAIWAKPNDTIKFANVPKTGITVSRGMTHDGLGKYLSEVVEKAPGDTDDVVSILKETGTDVVVNYLPVGSEEATKWYTEQILNAGCAMVNCMPVFIAKGGYFGRRFEERGLPIIGDDIKSQVGATITHRVLTIALPRARRPPRPDDAAERRRKLRLPEHARARAPRVEEDLEDERGHVDARLRPRRGQRPRRPVRPRAVAHRPQVGVHPHGGLVLRRRAAERRAQARGLGLAELGRDRDRRRAAREARAGQRRRRGARGAERLPDEVAAEADRDDEARDAVERFIKKNARTGREDARGAAAAKRPLRTSSRGPVAASDAGAGSPAGPRDRT